MDGLLFNWVNEMAKIKKPIAIAVFFAFLIVLCVMAFYNGLVVKKYSITTEKLSKDQSTRMVLITDLHSHIYGERQEKIASIIKKQKPDMIMLAGDIADDVAPITGTELFLDAIKEIAPIYYVTGNHEFWSKEIDSIRQVFRKYGVIILEHTYEEVTVNGAQFIIGGVDDPDIVFYEKPGFDWQLEMKNAFSGLENRTAYKILLSHRLELIELYKESPFDLVLSGHAHGGQVRIPFLLNGLFAPNQGWFPKYAGGLYEYDHFRHIVSRGVSFNPRLPRIFNPPEVVVVEITGER